MNELQALKRVRKFLHDNKHIKLKKDVDDMAMAEHLLKNYDFDGEAWTMKGTKQRVADETSVILNAARIGGLLDTTPGGHLPKYMNDWSEAKTKRAREFTSQLIKQYIAKNGIVFKDASYGGKGSIEDWVLQKIAINGYYADKDNNGQAFLRRLSGGYWGEAFEIDLVFEAASQGLVDIEATTNRQREMKAAIYAKAKAMAEVPAFDDKGNKIHQGANVDNIFKSLLEQEQKIKISKRITNVPQPSEILQDLKNEWIANRGAQDERFLTLHERNAYDAEPKAWLGEIMAFKMELQNADLKQLDERFKNYDRIGEDY